MSPEPYPDDRICQVGSCWVLRSGAAIAGARVASPIRVEGRLPVAAEDRATTAMEEPSQTEEPPATAGNGFISRLVSPLKQHWQDLLAVLLSMTISLLTAVYSTGARPSNLDVAWGNEDSIPGYSAAKSMIANGWWTPNPDLGYPFTQDSTSFPAPDFIALWLLKALTFLTGNPFTSLNVFYLLTFPAAALAGYLLFRFSRVSVWTSALLATSLALLPWHFERFEHLFLANYAFFLIGLLLIAVIMRGLPDTEWSKPYAKSAVFGSAALAVVVGLGGTYCAAFTTLVGAFALGAQFLAGRKVRDSIRSLLVLLLIPMTLGIALAAIQLSAVYKVTKPIARSPFESEIFGGQFYSLFRIANDSLGSGLIPKPLRDLTAYGLVDGGWEGDAFNNLISFGAILLTCCLLLMALASTSVQHRRAQHLLEQVGPWLLLFAISVALFVTTGVGSVIAAALSPAIRAWGRLSVMVVAIALVVLGLLLTNWWKSKRARAVFVVVFCMMAVVTVADPIVKPNPVEVKFGQAVERNVAPYVATAESKLASGCPVLELPISLYPEVPPTERSLDYSGLIPYLYSTDLRWSYGAVKTTDEGQWVKKNLDKPPAEQIALAKKAGFCALQLDMFGYPVADVAGVKATYEKLLGPPISVSNDKRWVMFTLG